jgi:hypothetical protein
MMTHHGVPMTRGTLLGAVAKDAGELTSLQTRGRIADEYPAMAGMLESMVLSSQPTDPSARLTSELPST